MKELKTAWEKLTNDQRKKVEEIWTDTEELARQDGYFVEDTPVLEGIQYAINRCGLEPIGKETTAEAIENLTFDDFQELAL